MSLILAALSGAGNALAKVAGEWDASLYKAEDEQRMTALQQQKDIAVHLANQQSDLALANQQRQADTAAIQQNYEGIANAKRLENWNKKAELSDLDESGNPVTDGNGNPVYRPATMEDVNNGNVNLATDEDAKLTDAQDWQARLMAEAMRTNKFDTLATLMNREEMNQFKYDMIQRINAGHDAERALAANLLDSFRKGQLDLKNDQVRALQDRLANKNDDNGLQKMTDNLFKEEAMLQTKKGNGTATPQDLANLSRVQQLIGINREELAKRQGIVYPPDTNRVPFSDLTKGSAAH